MIHDLTELSRAGRVLSEALALLKGERERLEQQHERVRDGDHSAGSPQQTLHGLRDLSTGVSTALEHVALAAGFISLGLDSRADHAVKMARMKPVGVPSGLDRMARPLGEATVRALEMIRGLDGFFGGDLGLAVDVALAAPQATYPPQDWAEYERQQRHRPQ
ncbi:hypothetical protein [Streptomyces lasiicapitis]|uniref:hypothetical protein n=1 Tax=Streptomyces lasiicapitis TaxID=1923961 RepID=UPI0036C003B5